MTRPLSRNAGRAASHFDPSRSFEQLCEIVRRTAITSDMTYEERLAAQRRRYGL